MPRCRADDWPTAIGDRQGRLLFRDATARNRMMAARVRIEGIRLDVKGKVR